MNSTARLVKKQFTMHDFVWLGLLFLLLSIIVPMFGLWISFTAIRPCMRAPRSTARGGCKGFAKNRFIFVQNYTGEAQRVDLGGTAYTDTLTQAEVSGTLTLAPYGYRIIELK